ncbi:MAG: TrgA family protein [Paracoccaceae bacterium]
MPTAAKLFAAIAFALLAFFAAEVVKPNMPPGTQFGYFSFYCLLIGLVCGWRIMGPAAGKGNVEAVNAGIRTAVAIVLIALLIFSIYEMMIQAWRQYYDGPMEAIVGIFGIALDFGRGVLVWDVMAVLLVGGGLAGLLSEWAARRWK